MKNLLFILLALSQICFAQKGKPTANPVWFYDSVYQSIWSTGAKDSSTESGRWNFVALPLAGHRLTNQSAYNIMIGEGAGQYTVAGKNNIFLGWEAAKNNTGSDNVAISEDALYSNTSGFANNVVGRGALFSHTRSKHNNAFGYNAMQAMTIGEENVSVGSYAMAFQLRGYGNVAIGTYAMENNDHYKFPNLTVINSVGIGFMGGFNSLGSHCINIGDYTETVGDNKINIGNTIYGDRITGNVSVKSITVSGKQVTFDDNFMYVVTSTGVKKVALQDVAATRVAPQQEVQQTKVPKGFILYDMNGQRLGKVVTAVPYYQ